MKWFSVKDFLKKIPRGIKAGIQKTEGSLILFGRRAKGKDDVVDGLVSAGNKNHLDFKVVFVYSMYSSLKGK